MPVYLLAHFFHLLIRNRSFSPVAHFPFIWISERDTVVVTGVRISAFSFRVAYVLTAVG